MTALEKLDMSDAKVVKLPTKAHYPTHIFGAETMIGADVSPSGFEQKEKTCANCGAVRVTIIGLPFPRAWRRNADGPQITTTLEPPCDKEASWPW